jgi:hypothetical protein
MVSAFGSYEQLHQDDRGSRVCRDARAAVWWWWCAPPLHLVGGTYLVRCLRCPLREKPGFRWPWIGFIASGWSLPGLAAPPRRGTAARLRYRGPPPFGGTPLASLVTTASAGRMGSWGPGPRTSGTKPAEGRDARADGGSRAAQGARGPDPKRDGQGLVKRGPGSARADLAAVVRRRLGRALPDSAGRRRTCGRG